MDFFDLKTIIIFASFFGIILIFSFAIFLSKSKYLLFFKRSDFEKVREEENLINNSTKKMQEKFCDIIIANDISNKEIGFNSDLNEVTIIDKNGKTQKIKKSSKKFVASLIAKKIVDTFLLNEKSLN